MLVGKVKRSPYAFAKILSIDTSKAEKLVGVHAEDMAVRDGTVYIEEVPEQKISIREAALYGVL